jgi:hypothetical protein
VGSGERKTVAARAEDILPPYRATRYAYSLAERPVPSFCNQTYSILTACTGSMDAARRAGALRGPDGTIPLPDPTAWSEDPSPLSTLSSEHSRELSVTLPASRLPTSLDATLGAPGRQPDSRRPTDRSVPQSARESPTPDLTYGLVDEDRKDPGTIRSFQRRPFL